MIVSAKRVSKDYWQLHASNTDENGKVQSFVGFGPCLRQLMKDAARVLNS